MRNAASGTVISHSEANAEFVTLARVVKTQGRWGEVAAEVHSDAPERFVEGMRLFALLANRSRESDAAKSDCSKEVRREVTVESLWSHKELLVVKFDGVDSISDAEALIGAELQVPQSERARLEPGWNYVHDLVGCAVLDSGHEIGRIDDVQFGAGEAPLLIVSDRTGKKFDVPFADAYLEAVDTGSREVRMKLPEGLLEVNAPLTVEEKSEQARLQVESSVSKRGSDQSPTTRGSRRSRR